MTVESKPMTIPSHPRGCKLKSQAITLEHLSESCGCVCKAGHQASRELQRSSGDSGMGQPPSSPIQGWPPKAWMSTVLAHFPTWFSSLCTLAYHRIVEWVGLEGP